MNTTNIPEKILNILGKEKCPNIILDTKFVEEVIYPAMEEYAELKVKVATMPSKRGDISLVICADGIERFI